MPAAYVKTGRGGAGNIFTPEELQKKEPTDLEAQQSQELANEVAQQQVETAGTGDGSEYKHMGRGGAGNWFTPSVLSTTGVFTDSHSSDPSAAIPDPTSVNPAHANRHIDPRPWLGRGGAGNFAYQKPVEPERIELEERQAIQEIEEEVRKEVDEALRRPESAYLSEINSRREQ
ncbi:hypothetical protein BDZ91DRAFT_718508 [Kalaharituber pfeilii]|nr:hypothetical protein BDZ91DRAFT_718508 [Kalaharituber pfeilii]